MSGTDFLMTKDRTTEIARGIYTLGVQGYSLAIETRPGVVLVDTGPGGAKTDAMITTLRTVTDKPVIAIVYSHGHLGYNFGVDQSACLERANKRLMHRSKPYSPGAPGAGGKFTT
jgi:glyoxylase-like metal-dependent hydrolase (beta-lactamase superfamily II)